MLHSADMLPSLRPESLEPPLEIGKRLRKLRERAGLSQAGLAQRMGVHQSALSRLEQQDDVLVSTLMAYVQGAGAVLQALAKLNDEVLSLFSLTEATSHDCECSRTANVLPEANNGNQRDVVFSIKPQFSSSILDGAKTVELRRRFPSNVTPGTLAFIYTTTPIRALNGVAEIEDVIKQSPAQIWKDFGSQACVSKAHFRSYFEGTSEAVAIKLRRARKLRRPVDLVELRERFNFEPPQSFLYAQPELRKALQDECSDLPHRHECLHRA